MDMVKLCLFYQLGVTFLKVFKTLELYTVDDDLVGGLNPSEKY